MMHQRKIIGAAAIAMLAVAVALTGTAAAQALTPKEELGKSIFFDHGLSINENQSCASCHAPEVGWTGPNETINAHGSVYEGSIPGRFGERKPPTSAYATFSPVLFLSKEGLWVGGNFWDGRATGWRLGNPAAEQAQGPFLNPAEQALPDSACVVYRVCAAPYPVSFEEVWGAGTCDILWPSDTEATCATEGGVLVLSPEDQSKSDQNYNLIAYSIAAYEASSEVSPFSAQYDYARANGMTKLSKEARKGFALFQGKGKCKNCHTSSGEWPLFTDYTYDNLGLPKNPENPVYDRDPDFVDEGLGGFLRRIGYPDDVWQAERGKVKVPTVRNVAKAPAPDFVKAFGHNGYFKSLKGIVHFYNTRDVKPQCPGPYTEVEALAADCWPPPEVTENLNTSELGNLGLTSEEEDAIVEFLKALSDGYVPGS